MKTDNIVIVGGGTAGWMTASTLLHEFPNKKITLVESPNIKTVGVGESTIGQINQWMSMLDIKDDEFMKACDASIKLSIKFVDFYKKDSGGFHYPFGKVTLDGGNFNPSTWCFKKMMYPDTPVTDYTESLFPQMALVNQNRMTFNFDGKLENFVYNRDAAYHFDATKFALWLRDNKCLPKGMKHIKSEVKKINTNNDGIESLELENGDIIKADLFIDCTGFKSMLLGDALKEPFESYEDIIPNNKAWATHVEYSDKKKQLEVYTTCTAIENGWVWNIPLWSRLGTGYVYSDKYITDEEALEQFKNHLKEKGHDISQCKFNKINMRVGIHNKIFVKNVCAIGLSAGFIEPLESNGLYSVHEFLMRLVRVMQRGDISQWDRDTFSMSCRHVFRGFSEFVSMHYLLSHRDDTEYWRDVTSRSVIDYPTISKHMSLKGFKDAMDNKMYDFSFPIEGGLHCIAMGMNWLPTDFASLKYENLDPDFNLHVYESPIKQVEERKKHWNMVVKKCPTLYEFLSDFYDIY